MLIGAWGILTWYVGDRDTSVRLSVDVGLSLLFLCSNNIACACDLEPPSQGAILSGNMSDLECALPSADPWPVCRAGFSGSHLSRLRAPFEVLEIESTASWRLLA